MKKLFILLLLFVIVAAAIMGVVINRQRQRVSRPAFDQKAGQSASPADTTGEGAQVSSTATASTTEGNITLTIESPQNNTTTSDSTITIQGKTIPGADVMVNEYELLAGADGSFSKSVPLDDGENYFSIVAYTAKGNVVERQLMVVKNVSSY